MQTERKIAVVLATIREASLKRFIDEWRDEFTREHIHVIIVEDNPHKQFSIDAAKEKFAITHYCWEDIKKDLGGMSG